MNAAPKMEDCADEDNNYCGNKCCKSTGQCWLCMAVWQETKKTAPYEGFSWVINVGAATVFLPETLGTKLPYTTGRDAGILIVNCEKILEDYFGMEECADEENKCCGNKCCKSTGQSCWNTGDQTGKRS